MIVISDCQWHGSQRMCSIQRKANKGKIWWKGFRWCQTWIVLPDVSSQCKPLAYHSSCAAHTMRKLLIIIFQTSFVFPAPANITHQNNGTLNSASKPTTRRSHFLLTYVFWHWTNSKMARSSSSSNNKNTHGLYFSPCCLQEFVIQLNSTYCEQALSPMRYI